MRGAALLLLLCTATVAAAVAPEFVRPLAAISQVPVTHDLLSRMIGAPAFAQLQRPVAVAAQGNIVYLYDAGPMLLYRYDRTQQTLLELPQVSGALRGVPAGIAVAPDRSFYVADPDGHQLLHIAFDGTILRSLSDDANLARPVAAVFDAERDYLLVADTLYDHVVAFNHLGWLLFGFGQRGQEPNQLEVLVDMAAGPLGLYVVDRLNAYIKIYSIDGQFLTSFPRKEVNNPAAIAVDKNDRVYVADSFDDTIKVYDAQRYVGEFGGTGSAPGKFRFITDLSIDNDTLFVADSMNGRVQVFAIEPRPTTVPELPPEGGAAAPAAADGTGVVQP